MIKILKGLFGRPAAPPEPSAPVLDDPRLDAIRRPCWIPPGGEPRRRAAGFEVLGGGGAPHGRELAALPQLHPAHAGCGHVTYCEKHPHVLAFGWACH